MTSLRPFRSLVEDCQSVLADVTGRWRVPAEALNEAILLQGWSIQHRRLPEGTFCVCDAWRQTLVVSDPLADQLDCPGVHREVLRWMLAAELGQIRMNSMPLLEGKYSVALGHTATEYAMAFLLPPEMLRAHPDVAYLVQSQPERIEGWRRLCRVAEYFLVPVACVQATLAHYGMLDYSWKNSQVA